EGGDVELRDPSDQREHALTAPQTKAREHVGEPVRQLPECAVGIVANLPTLAEPADGDTVARGPLRVAIHGLVRDVEAAPAREAVELRSRGLPAERGTHPLIVIEVRRDDGHRVHVNRRDRASAMPERSRAISE